MARVLIALATLLTVACSGRSREAARVSGSASPEPATPAASVAVGSPTPAPTEAVVKPGAASTPPTTAPRASAAVAPASAGQGVRGVVKIGPAPYCAPGSNSPCGDVPGEATVIVKRSGTVVAERRTGSDGRFQIDLAPGDYVVTARAERTTGCSQTGATVRDGAYTDVSVRCDTGRN